MPAEIILTVQRASQQGVVWLFRTGNDKRAIITRCSSAKEVTGQSDARLPDERAAPPRVAVVVLNWNGRQVLYDCLQSLMASHYPALEIVVVDNGSSDGSSQMVQTGFPQALLLRNSTNVGFCAGNNQGVRLALERGNQYVLILNNDTIVDAACIGRLLERAQSDPQIAAVSPKIYFWEPRDRLWFGGGTFSLWTGTNAHIGYKQNEQHGWSSPQPMDFICGCAMLVSRKAWQEVGGFDELLFRSSEDLDWSLRARKVGYKLFFEPSAVIWHRESFDIVRNEGMAGQMYFYTRNNLVVMWRHGRWWHWLTFVPYFVARSLKRAAIYARQRDWKAVLRIAQGFWDFPQLARQFGREPRVQPRT
jgi:GT2 family glycosyltransferase